MPNYTRVAEPLCPERWRVWDYGPLSAMEIAAAFALRARERTVSEIARRLHKTRDAVSAALGALAARNAKGQDSGWPKITASADEMMRGRVYEDVALRSSTRGPQDGGRMAREQRWVA